MINRDWEYPNKEETFFPVRKERMFWIDKQGKHHIVNNQWALVDDRDRILSIVTDRYNLITNEDAYHWADYVIRGVFMGCSLSDFKCFNVLMPTTRGSCRLDLIIPNSFKYPFGNKDSWVPFIRISNSYNKTIVLKYEVGFCRWICKNGVIIDQKGITFSFNHTEKISREWIESISTKAHKEIGEIGSLWSVFQMKLKKLNDIEVPISLWLAIFCKVFDIDTNKEKLTENQINRLVKKTTQIKESSKEYSSELGINAYALFNVLTDYASFPSDSYNTTNFIHGYQQKVGAWVNEFLFEVERTNFNLKSYIGEKALSSANFLESKVNKSIEQTDLFTFYE